jgi:hypothetical protein
LRLTLKWHSWPPIRQRYRLFRRDMAVPNTVACVWEKGAGHRAPTVRQMGKSDRNSGCVHWVELQMGNRARRELPLLARAFSGLEVRATRLADIRRAIETGTYRVPTRMIATSMMLEMLQ